MRGNPDTAQNRVQPVLERGRGAAARRAPASRSPSSATPAPLAGAADDQQRPRARPRAVAADHLPDPADRLRRVRRGRHARAARPSRPCSASGGLAALASHLVHASDATSSVMLLMGMAVGVDYSLFYLKREREERRAGHTHRDALERAAATSGRAVLVSGITVLIAMAGMLLTGIEGLRLDRRRRDARRVHRDGRLADGAAGAARHASATRSRRAGSARPQSRARACGTRCCGPVLRLPRAGGARRQRRCWCCWRCRRWACTRRCSAPATCRTASRSCAPTRRSRRPSPGARRRRWWSFAAATSTRPRRSARDRATRAAGARQRPGRASRSRCTFNRDHTVAQILAPARRQRQRQRVDAARCRRCATGCFRRASASCRARPSRSPARRPAPRLQHPDQAAASRSCSRSCSGSRSCCCW